MEGVANYHWVTRNLRQLHRRSCPALPHSKRVITGTSCQMKFELHAPLVRQHQQRHFKNPQLHPLHPHCYHLNSSYS